jgi:hypothetical protein
MYSARRGGRKRFGATWAMGKGRPGRTQQQILRQGERYDAGKIYFACSRL